MKKITFLLLLMSFVISFVNSQEISNGLSYWQTSVVAEKSVSYALEFDNVDDYVSIPNGTALIANEEEFSMCGWVYPSNPDTPWPDLDGFFGIKDEGVCDFYIAQIYGLTLEARITTSTGSYTLNPSDLSSVELDTWQHFALVYDGAEFKVYIDGILDGSIAATGTITYDNKELTIGTLKFSGNNFYLDGRVDEVTIWKKALTSEEIVDYACITEDPSTIDSLVAYYDFNDGTGSVLTDLLGGYDGTLTNMEETDWVEADICPAGYSIDFVVINSVTSLPVEEASIDVDGVVKLTDIDGQADFGGFDPGTYSYTITKEDYISQFGEIEIIDQDTLVEVNFIPILKYSISFIVTDYVSGDPIQYADVNVVGNIQSTNSEGEVIFAELLPGNYPYNIMKDGYLTETGSVEIIDQDTIVEAELIPNDTFTVSFVVSDELSGDDVEGAAVDLDGDIKYTNEYGVATFSDLMLGTYPYNITLDGYVENSGNVEVWDQNVVQMISLVPDAYSVKFIVALGDNGELLQDALINFDGLEEYTDVNGEATYEDVYPGIYNYNITYNDQWTTGGEVEVINEDVVVEELIWITTLHELGKVGVNIHPNPTNGILTVECNNNKIKELQMNIFSSAGGQVYQNQLSGKHTDIIDLSDQPSGLYILQLKLDNKMYNAKIVLEK